MNMDLLGSLLVAFSMYSAFPVPNVPWSERRMRYAMCFFPLIGAAEGVILLLFLRVFAGAGQLFLSLGGTALPLLLTGGIHMDGYLDVTDARRSFGSREEKLRIMKDPHLGAFAVIGAAVYLLLYTAGFSELAAPERLLAEGGFRGVYALAGLFAAERALSGLSLMIFPMAKKDGLAVTFSAGADRGRVRVVLILWVILSAVWMVRMGGTAGILCLLAAFVSFLRYRQIAVRDFGGTTGDLAGWFLERTELWGVLMCALCAVFAL
jgi:adenosylcobinamide-GDP ribazoletransferase